MHHLTPCPTPHPSPITLKSLADAGIVGKFKHGVKLVGGKQPLAALSTPIHIEVSAASAAAIAAVEAAGGSIKSVYYTPLALRSLLKPHKFDLPIMAPRPPPRKMRYFTSDENRGYLSRVVQLGEVARARAAGRSPLAAAGVLPVHVGGRVAAAGAAGLRAPVTAGTV